jgi:Flagellar hook-length control protein FliK
MLPANLLNTIKALALAQEPVLTAAADSAPGKTVQFEAGQKYQGSVQAQLSPGIFKVRIADQLVQMQLPESIRSGDTIELQVIATQPRLTFSMAASANPLSTPEQLGSMARLLSALSQQAPEKAYIRAPQSTPLWTAQQAPESAKLAMLLQQALSNSGLFYESHQVQWLEGGRSTAQLLSEPQNQPIELSAKVVTSDNTAQAPATAGPRANFSAEKVSAAVKAAVSEPANALTMTGTAARTTSTTTDSQPTGPSTTSLQQAEGKALNIPAHLQPLVQQQLNALETRQMLWHGNVWPGQTMQWEIHDQAPQTSAADMQRQWVTQLHLDLPRLGKVSAMLSFNSMGLNLALQADSAETRAILGSASTGLVTSLTDAGIPVISTQIAQHDHTR